MQFKFESSVLENGPQFRWIWSEENQILWSYCEVLVVKPLTGKAELSEFSYRPKIITLAL